jgi:hypothetical protein
VNNDGTLLMAVDVANNAAVAVETTSGDYVPLSGVFTTSTNEVYRPAAALSPDGRELYYSVDGGLQVVSLVP